MPWPRLGIFQQAECEVRTAAGVAEALSILEDWRPAVVVSDLQAVLLKRNRRVSATFAVQPAYARSTLVEAQNQ